MTIRVEFVGGRVVEFGNVADIGRTPFGFILINSSQQPIAMMPFSSVLYVHDPAAEAGILTPQLAAIGR